MSRAKLLENLATSINEEEVVSLISSAHSLLDNEAIDIQNFSADSAIKFLLDVDKAVLGSHATKYGQHFLKQTWKRLIKFYKSYHELISSEKADVLISALNCRSLHYVNLLSIILDTATIFDSSNKDQHAKMSELFFQLHSLVFYCQRISASLAYFRSIIDKKNVQVSVEILLSLRGFIALIKTGKYFIRIYWCLNMYMHTCIIVCECVNIFVYIYILSIWWIIYVYICIWTNIYSLIYWYYSIYKYMYRYLCVYSFFFTFISMSLLHNLIWCVGVVCDLNPILSLLYM